MRRPGIEPGPYDWKSDILPLNYRRIQKDIVSGIFILYYYKVIDMTWI